MRYTANIAANIDVMQLRDIRIINSHMPFSWLVQAHDQALKRGFTRTNSTNNRHFFTRMDGKT
ncbi:Uncharacterised protein [Vibrio cholerae]|nr:Uncharacterised protein [Vibrio cholerae]